MCAHTRGVCVSSGRVAAIFTTRRRFCCPGQQTITHLYTLILFTVLNYHQFSKKWWFAITHLYTFILFTVINFRELIFVSLWTLLFLQKTPQLLSCKSIIAYEGRFPTPQKHKTHYKRGG